MLQTTEAGTDLLAGKRKESKNNQWEEQLDLQLQLQGHPGPHTSLVHLDRCTDTDCCKSLSFWCARCTTLSWKPKQFHFGNRRHALSSSYWNQRDFWEELQQKQDQARIIPQAKCFYASDNNWITRAENTACARLAHVIAASHTKLEDPSSGPPHEQCAWYNVKYCAQEIHNFP